VLDGSLIKRREGNRGKEWNMNRRAAIHGNENLRLETTQLVFWGTMRAAGFGVDA
jgi:hypothetical protein